MRRIITLIGFAGAVALAGCGHHALGNVTVNTNLPAPKPAPPAQVAMATKPAPPTAGSEFVWQDLHFGFDDANLTDADRSILATEGAYLIKNTDRVEVEGNCDERGSVEYNLALGERRAKAAKEYLTTYGIPGSRITTISFGKERPVDPGHDEAAWAKNRRDHFAEQKPNS